MAKVTVIESDYRIQLPPEWVEELGLRGCIAMEKGTEGITVRPCSRITWDEVFADKLQVGSRVTDSDSFELSGDEYLF